MRKYGGFIPDPAGQADGRYIDNILARVTLAAPGTSRSSRYSGVHAHRLGVAPTFIGERLDAILPSWFTQGMGITFAFGGTSLLIVVGVAMDTVQQVESQLIMRHYDGFMKKTRIRGRRA
jgi:preprotein translocase subunit SecY